MHTNTKTWINTMQELQVAVNGEEVRDALVKCVNTCYRSHQANMSKSSHTVYYEVKFYEDETKTKLMTHGEFAEGTNINNENKWYANFYGSKIIHKKFVSWFPSVEHLDEDKEVYAIWEDYE